MTKKLWIDDVRPTPEGWDRAYTGEQAIDMLATRMYDCVSFDHDLGTCAACELDNNNDCRHVKNGYDVACWLEEQVATDDEFPVPHEMFVHSDNGPGRIKISQAIASIIRIGICR